MRTDKLSDPAVLEHFRESARDFPREEPMFAMVKRLSAKAYADNIPVSTSLDVLVAGWDEGEESEGVSIAYHTDRHQFLVRYYPRNIRKIEHYCDANGAENLFDSFVLRLFIIRRNAIFHDTDLDATHSAENGMIMAQRQIFEATPEEIALANSRLEATIVSPDSASGTDNEDIDADMAREYGDNHAAHDGMKDKETVYLNT